LWANDGKYCNWYNKCLNASLCLCEQFLAYIPESVWNFFLNPCHVNTIKEWASHCILYIKNLVGCGYVRKHTYYDIEVSKHL
jgi:hypothetical protein